MVQKYFVYLPVYLTGGSSYTECSTFFNYTGNPYELVSEKALAEKIYNLFCQSEWNWNALMDKKYTRGALSIKIGHYNTIDGDQYNFMIAVFTRLDDYLY